MQITTGRDAMRLTRRNFTIASTLALGLAGFGSKSAQAADVRRPAIWAFAALHIQADRCRRGKRHHDPTRVFRKSPRGRLIACGS